MLSSWRESRGVTLARIRIVDLEGEGAELQEILRQLAGLGTISSDEAPLALPAPDGAAPDPVAESEPGRPKAKRRNPALCPECGTAWASLKHREHKARMMAEQQPS